MTLTLSSASIDKKDGVYAVTLQGRGLTTSVSGKPSLNINAYNAVIYTMCYATDKSPYEYMGDNAFATTLPDGGKKVRILLGEPDLTDKQKNWLDKYMGDPDGLVALLNAKIQEAASRLPGGYAF